jgi:oligopeptide transport system permease protein
MVADTTTQPPPGVGWRALRSGRVLVGGGVLALIGLACVATLFATTAASANHGHGGDFYFDNQHADMAQQRPQLSPAWMLFGSTKLGQSLLGRCLLGGAISLAVGLTASLVAVVLGVTVGAVSGYMGGWVDALLMRTVDVLYGLPYILLVILFKLGLERPLGALLRAPRLANVVVLFLAIGLASWLTMARVIRGQVLSLRNQPFMEATRSIGAGPWRIFTRHLLPNLIGPITVYATLTVPEAILQESLLSFLGVGIQPPLPTWGSLASEGLIAALNPVVSSWWLLVFPCTLLAVTLLALNFIGDGLRDVFDPKRIAPHV